MDDGSIAGVIVQKSYITRFGLTADRHSASDIASIKGNLRLGFTGDELIFWG